MGPARFRGVPELIEIEAYRHAAEPTIGRVITAVDVIDPNYVKGVPPSGLVDAMVGERIVGLRRIGKLLLLDLSTPLSVGLRFGMTGRLVVDGSAPIDRLVYGATTGDAKWDRFAVFFATGSLVIHDPRRLGSVELEPDEHKLGPDAATITAPALQDALASTPVALKARLMDQAKIAGLGNLLTDEILWRAEIDPLRPAGSLTPKEVDELRATIVATVDLLSGRGGSHTGDLQAQRSVAPGAAGYCPRDGEPLRRDQVGGRTTVWCPAHQR